MLVKQPFQKYIRSMAESNITLERNFAAGRAPRQHGETEEQPQPCPAASTTHKQKAWLFQDQKEAP